MSDEWRTNVLGSNVVQKITLTYEQLRAYAATHRPPQEWYDEDMAGMWTQDEQC